MLLVSKDISVTRVGSAALRFPDVTISEQQNILLLGPSGSGKTTWLCVLAGLLKPQSGFVMIEAVDIYALPARKRDLLRGRAFGFIFQSLHLLPSLTLRDNIKLAADMAGLKCDPLRLRGLISSLGLSVHTHKKPQALSLGEQQRTAVARAVINRPKIIFADEPTSALDDRNAGNVMQLLLAQAAETGASLIVATHDERIKPHFKKIIRLDNRTEEVA